MLLRQTRLSPFVFQNCQVFSVDGVECELGYFVAGRSEIGMVELFLKVFGILAEYDHVTLARLIR